MSMGDESGYYRAITFYYDKQIFTRNQPQNTFTEPWQYYLGPKVSLEAKVVTGLKNRLTDEY